MNRAVAIINADYIEGATIEEVAESMCDLAQSTGCYVRFTYEGIEMTVSFHHDADYVLAEWTRRKAAPVLVDFVVEGEVKQIEVRSSKDRGYPDIDPINHVI